MVEYGTREKWPKAVIINTDGASRGNPGPAAVGICVRSPNDETIYELGKNLGIQTNNFAEYTAVKIALELAVEQKIQDLILRSDSEFLIKQMKGEYKVKSENIKPIYLECSKLVSQIKNVVFEHVRREYNKRADELANLSLDRT